MHIETARAYPGGFPKAVRRLGDALGQVLLWIAGASVTVIVLICTVNVIGRYVFLHAFTWAEEAMVYAMILTIFTAAATVTWRGGHMRLDMLVNRLPQGLQLALSLFVAGASAVLLGTLALSSLEVVERLYRYGQMSDALVIPMWVPQGCVTLGLGLVTLMTVLRLLAFDPRPAPHDLSAEIEEGTI